MTDVPASRSHPRIVVGVTLHQPDALLIRAAEFAGWLGAEMVCAHVDVARYTTAENPDGSVTSLPFDPDLPELGEETFDPVLARQIEATMRTQNVPWSLRALAGEPVRALAHLADRLDARAIVVGTRETGRLTSVHDFFAGSVGLHLAHRQHRPVLLIPLSPVGHDAQLPWEQ